MELLSVPLRVLQKPSGMQANWVLLMRVLLTYISTMLYMPIVAAIPATSALWPPGL